MQHIVEIAPDFQNEELHWESDEVVWEFDLEVFEEVGFPCYSVVEGVGFQVVAKLNDIPAEGYELELKMIVLHLNIPHQLHILLYEFLRWVQDLPCVDVEDLHQQYLNRWTGDHP